MAEASLDFPTVRALSKRVMRMSVADPVRARIAGQLRNHASKHAAKYLPNSIRREGMSCPKICKKRGMGCAGNRIPRQPASTQAGDKQFHDGLRNRNAAIRA